MENNVGNELIRTDTAMYKIKRFFTNLFVRKNYETPIENEITEAPEDIELNLDKVILNKTETQEKESKDLLASKLMKKELPLQVLSDEEVEEMLKFFKEKVLAKRDELKKLKVQLAELEIEFGSRKKPEENE